MKKIIVTFICVVFISVLSFAKESNKPAEKAPMESSILSGKIIDETSGEELVGVAVKINGTNLICYTDFEGNFEFNDVQPGEYKLNVEYISYKNLETKKIAVGNKEAHELKIKLHQEI